MRRAALLVLALAAGFVLLAAAGLFFAAHSSRVLEWGLARLAAVSSGRLQFEGVSGSLADVPSVARVRFRDGDVSGEARDVRLDWYPAALVFGRLSVASIEVSEMEVNIASTDAPSPVPQDLVLPLSVGLDSALVHKLIVRFDDTTIPIEALRFAYRGDASGHQLEHLSARVYGATASGDATLAAKPPFALAGTLGVQYAQPPVPLDADIRLGGTLERVEATIAARAKPFESATATLVLAPFAVDWLAAAKARIEGLDLAKLDTAAPVTTIALSATARFDEKGRPTGELVAENGSAGPIDKNALPIARATSRYTIEPDGTVVLDPVVAVAPGGGTAEGTAKIAGEKVVLALGVRGIDLRQIYSSLRKSALAGRIDATVAPEGETWQAKLAESGIDLAVVGRRRGDDVVLERVRVAAGGGTVHGAGKVRISGTQPFEATLDLAGFDPAALGDYPAASLTGKATVSGRLARPWSAKVEARLAGSRFRGAALAGGGAITVSEDRVQDADVALTLGGTRLAGRGALGRPGDELQVEVDARNLAEIDARLAGHAVVRGKVSGPFARPAVSATLRGESLAFPGGSARSVDASGDFVLDLAKGIALEQNAPLRIEARGEAVAAAGYVASRANVRIEGTAAKHTGELDAKGADFDVTTKLEGGWDGKSGWSGVLATLVNRGPYPIALKAPATLEVSRERFRIGAFEASVAGGSVDVRDLRLESGRLTTAGAFAKFPATVLLAAASVEQPLRSTLTLAGEWSLSATPQLSGTITVRREAGDVEVLTDPVFDLGLTRADLEVRFVNDRAYATLAVAGTSIGELRARGEAQPIPTAEGVRLAADSPLEATISADLASLKPFAPLLDSSVALDGSLKLALHASGTLRHPILEGTLVGEQLRAQVPLWGIDWRDGRLRAELGRKALDISEFSVRAGGGTFSAQGRVPRAKGEGGPRIEWRAEHFLALNRPDRRLVVSGEGAASLDGRRALLSGRLVAEEGRFEFGRSELPELGDDVVIVGREEAQPRARGRVPVALDLDLDFGQKLAISGYGLEGLLGGNLKVTTDRNGEPVGKGRLNIRQGTYRAYGQNLRIETGRLLFDGRLDNPALEVTAWRRNQAVEAGVEVSGTVRVPRVRILSQPSVPEGEALAWLVLGRGPDASNRADIAALQVATAALFSSSGTTPMTRQIARAVGLDDITFGTASAATGGATPGLSNSVVSFGKRLSDRVYLTYEQAIAAVGSVIRLDYMLTQRLSLRLEGGTRTGIGFNYRYSFD